MSGNAFYGINLFGFLVKLVNNIFEKTNTRSRYAINHVGSKFSVWVRKLFGNFIWKVIDVELSIRNRVSLLFSVKLISQLNFTTKRETILYILGVFWNLGIKTMVKAAKITRMDYRGRRINLQQVSFLGDNNSGWRWKCSRRYGWNYGDTINE